MKVTELKYSKTNTYLIEGDKGCLLFDTGWAGTYTDFCRALGAEGKKAGDIDFILISHYHPDHMGIAQEIADEGPVIAVAEEQKDFIHFSDHIFEKENRKSYRPVDISAARIIKTGDDSRKFLEELGIGGVILHTPGHSDDSISLLLDSGELFVGDLNPLYELELHAGTEIEKSWEKLLESDPCTVYYGHAKTLIRRTQEKTEPPSETAAADTKYAELAGRIMKLIDKGWDIKKICRKTGADETFVQDVMRMYLTHPGVSVQGVLDRIEIKGR